MKSKRFIWVSRIVGILLLFFAINLSAQSQDSAKSDFWKHVQFGGGVGASFGNGYTDVSLAPGAIYNFNEYVAFGVGLQGSFVKVRGNFNSDNLNNYQSWIYGGSLLALLNPIEQIQLSAELEQVRVNTTFNYADAPAVEDDFWNTALFLGVGYRSQNVTIGIRYNVLYDRNKSVYFEPFMPFVRVFF